MTPEQYFVEFKKLGFTPTKVPTVFIDAEGMTHSVPDPHDKTPEQRAEVVAMKKWQLGVGPKPDGVR